MKLFIHERLILEATTALCYLASPFLAVALIIWPPIEFVGRAIWHALNFPYYVRCELLVKWGYLTKEVIKVPPFPRNPSDN